MKCWWWTKYTNRNLDAPLIFFRTNRLLLSTNIIQANKRNSIKATQISQHLTLSIDPNRNPPLSTPIHASRPKRKSKVQLSLIHLCSAALTVINSRVEFPLDGRATRSPRLTPEEGRNRKKISMPSSQGERQKTRAVHVPRSPGQIVKRDAGKFVAFLARSARPVIGAENCAHVTPNSVTASRAERGERGNEMGTGAVAIGG